MFEWLKHETELEWIAGIKYWHKLYSLRFALMSAACGFWSANNGSFSSFLSPKTFAALSMIFALLSGFSTLIRQPKLLEKLEKDQDS
jgi:hypothetical protein